MGPEDCPPEVWGTIFALACRDDGSTAIALSQVSRLINTYSKPYRYQSIALTGSDQIIAFEAAISSVPPQLRRMKNLFVHNPPPSVYTSDTYDRSRRFAHDDDYFFGDSSFEEGTKDGQDSAHYDEDFTVESGSEEAGQDSDLHSDAGESSDDNSFHEPTTEEQAELAEDVEILAEMRNSPIPMSCGTLEWLQHSLSALDRRKSTILSAFRRILEAVAPSLETLSVHWVMYEFCLLKVLLPELPLLRDLSVYREHPHRSQAQLQGGPELLWWGPPTPFPSLRRFQIEGYLEAAASCLTMMAPSLTCLHTNEVIFRKVKLFLPTTLKKIILHPVEAMHLTSQGRKKELLGVNYREGVGKCAEFVVDPYSEDYEVWMDDWEARINGEGDAVSIEEELET